MVLAEMALLIDVAAPPAPTASGPVDFGTLVRWTVMQGSTLGGSATGTMRYIVLPDGAPAPTQRLRTIQGLEDPEFYNGFYADFDETAAYNVGDRVSVGELMFGRLR